MNERWRKSSYSSSEANCVEVAFLKSSYSSGEANCIEVAISPAQVAVRDSKAPAQGELILSTRAWQAFARTKLPA